MYLQSQPRLIPPQYAPQPARVLTPQLQYPVTGLPLPPGLLHPNTQLRVPSPLPRPVSQPQPASSRYLNPQSRSQQRRITPTQSSTPTFRLSHEDQAIREIATKHNHWAWVNDLASGLDHPPWILPVSEDPEPFTDAVNSLSVPPTSRVEDAFESDIGAEHLSYDLRFDLDTVVDAEHEADGVSESPLAALFVDAQPSMEIEMDIGEAEPLWTDLLNGFSPTADAGVDRGGLLGSPVSI